VLFFVDADVMVSPDAIERVLGYFHREPEIDALFGSYDDQPAEPNFLSQYRNLLHHYVHQCGREEASTFWGACGAIRRDVFLAALTRGMPNHRLKTSSWATVLGKQGRGSDCANLSKSNT
jgi:cellulose synthase/poly-beta-1,6-N-acetylglucosamine synthase-like glycosyltransferase